MNRKKVLLGISVLTLALVSGYGYREYTRTHEDLLQEQPDVVLDATALLSTYEKDTAAFYRKYIDQLIAVTGTVKQIDSTGYPFVISLGGSEGISSVQCSMDSVYVDLYKNSKVGSAVTIKGICTGGRTDELFGTDVLLHRCVPELKK